MAATSTTLGSTSVYRVEKSLTDVVSDHCAVSGRLVGPRVAFPQKGPHLVFSLQNPDDSFYIVDLGTIIKKCYQWKKNLPRVEPFYGIFEYLIN